MSLIKKTGSGEPANIQQRLEFNDMAGAWFSADSLSVGYDSSDTRAHFGLGEPNIGKPSASQVNG